MLSEFAVDFKKFIPTTTSDGLPEGQSIIRDKSGAPQLWQANGRVIPIAAMMNPMIGVADRTPMGLPISFIINHKTAQSTQTMGSTLSDITGINIDVAAAVGHFFNEVGKVFAAIWDAIIHIDWGKLFSDIMKVIQIVALVIAILTPIGIAITGVSLSSLTGTFMVDVGQFLSGISQTVADVLTFPIRFLSGGAIETNEIMSNFFFGPKIAANSLTGGTLADAFDVAGTSLLEDSTTDIIVDYGKSAAISAAASKVPGGGLAAGFLMDNSGNIVDSIAHADLSSVDLTTIPGAIASAINNISISAPDLSNISISAPSISMPSISAPSISIPSFSAPELNVGQIPDISMPSGAKKKVVSKKKKTLKGKTSTVYTLADGSEYEVSDETNLMPFFIAAGLVMMITGRG